MARGVAILAVVLVAGWSCNGLAITPACDADLQVGVTPQDTTIRVGQQFPVHLTLLGCRGTRALSDTITYASANPAIAAVDSASGLVTGEAVGATSLTVTARHYRVTMHVGITVQ